MTWTNEEKQYLTEVLDEIREGYNDIYNTFLGKTSVNYVIKRFINNNIHYDSKEKVFFLYVGNISGHKFYKFFASTKDEMFTKLKEKLYAGFLKFPDFSRPVIFAQIDRIQKLNRWLEKKYEEGGLNE